MVSLDRQMLGLEFHIDRAVVTEVMVAKAADRVSIVLPFNQVPKQFPGERAQVNELFGRESGQRPGQP